MGASLEWAFEQPETSQKHEASHAVDRTTERPIHLRECCNNIGPQCLVLKLRECNDRLGYIGGIRTGIDPLRTVLPLGGVMNTPRENTAAEGSAKAGAAPVDFVSVPEMYRLLARAAELASHAGLPPEAFMASAWQSYLHASPDLAEHMAEMQFAAALEELRSSGRLAKA